MQKIVSLIVAAPEADRAAFRERWLAEAQSMARAAAAPLRQIVNLVDVSLDDSPPLPPYDVVSEMWFDGEAELPAGPVGAGATWHYRVAERIQLDRRGTWPAGTRSPGVKAIYLVRRPDGLSAQDAARLWREHAPVAREHHIGMAKYVQNGVIESLTPGAPIVHGIAELHFPAIEDFRERMYDSPEGREVVAADAARLVGEATMLLASEYIVRA